MIRASTKSDLVSYPIRDIIQEAKEQEKAGTDMLYLNIGDPGPYGFRPPHHILSAIKEAIDSDYSGYAPSAGDPELIEEIAKREQVDNGDVFVCSGLSEGIDFLFQAMLDPGRNLILPVPSYPLYLTKERIGYGTMNFYGCDENFIPDPDLLRKGIDEYTKAIVIINPNNPTGAVYPRKILEEIVDIAGEYEIPIISDDAYEKLVIDGDYTNLRDICKDVPLVSGNSLSKNYIYPGARVGYVAFHGDGWDEIKDSMQRLSNQRLSVNWEMQRGYLAALRGSDEHVNSFKEILRRRRDLSVKRINEIDGMSTPVPNGAFYAFVKVENRGWKDDWAFVRDLLKMGVVVVPGSAFSPTFDSIYFRMVFLPTEEELEESFDRMERLMGKR